MTAHRTLGVLFLAESRIEGIAPLCSERQSLSFRGATLSAVVVATAAITAALNQGSNASVVAPVSASAAAVVVATLGLVSWRRSSTLKNVLRKLISDHDYGDDPDAATMKRLALADIRGLIENGSTQPAPNGGVVTLNGNNIVYGIDRRLAK